MTMAANMNGLAAMGPQARGILGASYAYWRFVYSVGWIFQTQSTPGTNSLTNQGTVLSSSAPVTGDKIRIECSGNIIAGFLNNVFFAACISSAASTGIVTGMNGNPNSTLTFAQFSLFTTGTFSSLPNALMLTGCGT
jgi:hypothetical protein